MFPIPQIAQPRFQRYRVIFAYHCTISNDVCLSRDGSPLAGRIEKGNIDLRVGLQIVGFAGLGVGMKYEIDAIAFLFRGRGSTLATEMCWMIETYLGGQSHAS